MNSAETRIAGSAQGICARALELAMGEARNYWEQEQNSAELAAHRATSPICGKPGRGFKAWQKKNRELLEESEFIYQSNYAHAIHNYTSANNLMFRPSDLRDGRHHEMRRSAQESRHEEMERARAFVAANYTPADDAL